ncbi:MAG: FAD:protein FMN transferase [Actinobacteria bacterium]|nr:FAD:protein FMN transferase [Actinomycetota bacterium]
MGLPISLALRGRHAGDDAARAAWSAAVAQLREVDAVFSTYRPDSCVSRLNRGELDLVDCPPEVHEVLALAEQAYADSGGAFDVWRADRDGRRMLDADGVVKGWATQRASRILADLPATDGCLSAGGDLVCWTPTGADPWQIGIEDPARPDRLIARIPVRDGAVATSGFAHRGAHIVDARTGAVAIGLASVTVVAPDLTSADVDATSAYAHGAQALDWLATRPGRAGVVVLADGSVHTFATPGRR